MSHRPIDRRPHARPHRARPVLRIALTGLLLAGLVAAAATARPARKSPRLTPAGQANPAAGPEERLPGLIVGLSSGAGYDTAWFGGTVWAADSNRWEAIPGGTWTFDSGVGSAIQQPPGSGGKPAGYHRLMEGWVGLDLSIPHPIPFHRSTTCAISGSWSMWVGATEAEADSMEWAGGQGYGNSWDETLQQAFSYPGSGNVTLQFQYAVEAEPEYDYLEIAVRRSGAASDVVLAIYDGTATGTASFTLTQAGGTLPSGSGTVTVKFHAVSDGGYSDEDGVYLTNCGLASIDNIGLSGAITHSATFEAGLDGWTTLSNVFPPLGDYSNLRDVADLPPVTGFFCSDCGLRDSVLVFVDSTGTVPEEQWNLAISPWIDLRATGDVGRPGKILAMNLYRNTGDSPPISTGYQYYPYTNSRTGKVGVSPLYYTSTIYYFGLPVCGWWSGYCDVPPEAEQVRVAVGPLYTTYDATPYVDNVRFGVYGPTHVPTISVNAGYKFQDSFAADGSLNPASTGRIDIGYPKSSSPTVILGDTLMATSYGDNVEVRLVFHVRPGPFTNPTELAAAAARWTAEASIGPGWYSARMDTAEQAGSKPHYSGYYMSTFHESDPGFQGTDRAPDPQDPSQLANDILPDHLFTPGSRIDYFLKARYLPPDPRNPGGTAWYLLPDTTGGNFWEMEVLPSSMTADTTWNCVLLIDGHDAESASWHQLEEAALNYALGPGNANAEKTRFDRWDAPAYGVPGQLGRPAGSAFGASLTQANGYRRILWYSGNTTPYVAAEDATILDGWLRTDGGAGRGFWANGQNFATAFNSTTGGLKTFLNNTLGVLYSCGAARGANCPAGTPLDSTYCLPLTAAAAPAFPPSGSAGLRGNGCPDVRGFDGLAANPAVTTAAGNLSYVKNGSAAPSASITNNSPAGYTYRTVVDGFQVSLLRRTPSNPHDPGQCTNTIPVYERTLDVLRWLETSDCPTVGVTGTPEPEPTPAVVLHPWLGEARPNPMRSGTRILFSVDRPDATTALRIFDVAGRLVRTLPLGPLEPGQHEVRWDGRADSGRRVAAGLYFYRLTSPGFVAARKLIVLE